MKDHDERQVQYCLYVWSLSVDRFLFTQNNRILKWIKSLFYEIKLNILFFLRLFFHGLSLLL